MTHLVFPSSKKDNKQLQILSNRKRVSEQASKQTKHTENFPSLSGGHSLGCDLQSNLALNQFEGSGVSGSQVIGDTNQTWIRNGSARVEAEVQVQLGVGC